MYTGELNHALSTRNREGLKEDKVHARVNHNPSEASPGDELVIKMPQLTPSSVIYPNSLYLTYNYKLASDGAEVDIPDHLTSAIVERFKKTVNGQTVFDINNYNQLAIHREFWHPKHKYQTELTHRGIQSSATKKKRHAITGAVDDTLASVHEERYSFPLGSFFTESAFTPQAVHNTIEYHLKFTSGKYSLKNICLEYDYVINPVMAASIKQKYVNHTHIFNDYKSHTTVTVPAAESDLEININASFESLRTIIMFFKPNGNASTTYSNPLLKDVKIDIDGSTNQLFTSEYLAPYAYQDARKYFVIDRHAEAYINQESFYDSKYCLVLDLRTLDDEKSSGIGRQIKDYVKVKLSKKVTTAAGQVFVFLVTDKAVTFVNNQISSIEQ